MGMQIDLYSQTKFCWVDLHVSPKHLNRRRFTVIVASGPLSQTPIKSPQTNVHRRVT
jgi:hypothetical protein